MLPTVKITAVVNDSAGQPVESARIVARLNRAEVYQGIVVPRTSAAVTDATGRAVLNLWPNELGALSSAYEITIRRPGEKVITSFNAVVPNNDATLDAIAVLAPFPAKTDVERAQEAAVAASGEAQSAAIAAGDSETNAAASASAASSAASSAAERADADAQEAADAATAAAGSATAAAGSSAAADDSEVAAAGSATAAGQSADAAGASAQAAALSEGHAQDAQSASETAEAGAQDAQTAAETARDRSEAWADTPEGVAVDGVEFSSKHYAAKSSEKAGDAAGSAAAASDSASEAATHEANALTSETNAATSEESAASSASAAGTSADLSHQWADSPEGVVVADGEYSAFHWAQQARQGATGSLIYKGSWDASTGAYPASPSLGDFYKVSGAGTVGTIDYGVGDQVIYNGTAWDKIDNTEQVMSVAGRVGDVTLYAADVGLGNVANDLQLLAAENLADLPDKGAAMANLGVYAKADVDTLLDAKADLAGASFTGDLSATLLRLTSAVDASATSTGHGLQVGPDAGANLIIDNNEIMARNNGVVSTLYLNKDGGDVSIGSATLDGSGNLAANGASFSGTVTVNNGSNLGVNWQETCTVPDGTLGKGSGIRFGATFCKNWSGGDTGTRESGGIAYLPSETSASPRAHRIAFFTNSYSSDSLYERGSIDNSGHFSAASAYFSGTVSAGGGTGGNVLSIGNDAWLADVNRANTFGIRGAQNPHYGGIQFGNGPIIKTRTGTSLYVTGDLYPTGSLVASGNVTAYSDERLKANIETIPNALDTLCRLRGVNFTRTDLGTPGTGVIAQEVLPHIPELVHVPDDPEEMLSVAYANALGYVVEALKEVAERLERLEARR